MASWASGKFGGASSYVQDTTIGQKTFEYAGTAKSGSGTAYEAASSAYSGARSVLGSTLGSVGDFMGRLADRLDDIPVRV